MCISSGHLRVDLSDVNPVVPLFLLPYVLCNLQFIPELLDLFIEVGGFFFCGFGGFFLLFEFIMFFFFVDKSVEISFDLIQKVDIPAVNLFVRFIGFIGKFLVYIAVDVRVVLNNICKIFYFLHCNRERDSKLLIRFQASDIDFTILFGLIFSDIL